MTGGAGALSGRGRPGEGRREEDCTVATVLWVIAVILVVAGIVSLVRGQVIGGAVLIALGLLVGPGGVSIFT